MSYLVNSCSSVSVLAALMAATATALACAAFAEQLQPRLIAQKITRNVSRTQEDSTPEQIVVGRTVSDYLKRIGVYGQ